MRVSPDTNVLVRSVVRDNLRQAKIADELLGNASIVAVTTVALCELVWVLGRVYSVEKDDMAAAIEVLLESENVVVDRRTVDAGLLLLRAGGDFGDGVIAHEGRELGGDTLVSFDKQAVRLLRKQGHSAVLLKA